MRFTDAQRDAISYRGGHLQLLACSGAGKTEVVAQRVAAMLDPSAPDALAPRNIVAFTFTDRAAAELKARIARRVRETYGVLPGMAEMFVGTIHAFCVRLLQEEIPEFLRYSVLDEARQLMLIQREPTRSGFDTVFTCDSNSLAKPEEIRRFVNALDVLRQAELDRSKLHDRPIGAALDHYRELLRRESFLDYTSQLELAVDSLRRNIDLGQRIAARVRHVVVDEYQDTNSLQEQVVRALAELGATLTVVGDDDQTIFQWNGADVENILGFADRYVDARQLRLEANFRSSSPIVTFARDFVAAIDRRLPKAMQPTNAQPFEQGDLLALSFNSEWDEARFIARKIKELRGVVFTENGQTRGLSWSDVAILIRGSMRWAARAIVQVLEEAEIPFVVTGVNTLFECSEIRAVCATFAYLGDDEAVDEAAVRTAWREARLGVVEAELDRTVEFLRASRELLRGVASWPRSQWRELGLQRLFLAAIDVLGVREESVPGGYGQEVFLNLGRFSKVLGDFESMRAHEDPRARIVAFCEYLRTSASGENEQGSAEFKTRDAVRVTTVHRSKGLQWPVVFLLGVAEGRFPMAPRAQPLWEIVPRDAVRAPQRYESGEEDERRLFYVAVTRAQKFLFVSWAGGRGGRNSAPSPYFKAFASHQGVETADLSLRGRARAEPAPKSGVTDVRLTFSEIKPVLDCAYRFKLTGIYGFRAPFEEAQGFGKALHDALAEVHRRALEGDFVTPDDVPHLVKRHVHLPFASPETAARLREHAHGILARYLARNGDRLDEVELVEKPIEVQMGNGITVEGRIDLVCRRADDEVAIVDFKSDKRAQAEETTDVQLRLYSLGYEALTGRRPERIEVWELDTLREHARAVNDEVLDAVRAQVVEVARRVRTGDLSASPEATRCASCSARSVCGSRVDHEPSTPESQSL